MPYSNIFNPSIAESVINRINNLKPTSTPQWGKMSVAEMLAHCNVTYEMIYEDIHPKPSLFKKWLLTMFVKNAVVNDVPYQKNIRTAPQFIIKNKRDFDIEKARLIQYINRTVELGEDYFSGKQSFSFGPLTTQEWNNMMHKHLDHHLTQFGV